MFIQKNYKKIGFTLIIVSLAMNIVSYFYLPEKLVMQIKFDGTAGTTLPTIIGLLSLFALLALFVYKLFFSKETGDKIKWTAVSVIILLVNFITVIFNFK